MRLGITILLGIWAFSSPVLHAKVFERWGSSKNEGPAAQFDWSFAYESEMNLNGIEGVEEHQGAGLYKYTAGSESTLAGARKLQDDYRAKGFDGCFIVAFKGDTRIGLQEALKLADAQ